MFAKMLEGEQVVRTLGVTLGAVESTLENGRALPFGADRVIEGFDVGGDVSGDDTSCKETQNGKGERSLHCS